MNTQSIANIPWLFDAYKQLAGMYATSQGHHALLLQSTQGVGEHELIQSVGHFLLCQAKQKTPIMTACGVCTSCKLINANNHPDWHVIELEKDKKSIGVDAIRTVINELHQHANQGGAKLIEIENLEILTEAAANALLKILEEPTDNTFFLLTTYAPSELLATIKSRCLAYPLLVPREITAIEWLKDKGTQLDNDSLKVGLRLAHGAPILASEILNESNWANRITFNTELYDALKHKAYLKLASYLSSENWLFHLESLIAYLLDALKYQSLHKIPDISRALNEALINIDRIDIISELALQDHTMLVINLQEAMHIRYTLVHNPSINTELMITNWLLRWQQNRLEQNYL
ncbi:DNA polymerase III subunit delta' C-terminal domain-containing protein [Thorsellia anophelis]|uniref:DNA polymerase III subunit delta' n=1 Tax=Thorsellia anophelis DSM 18579 TaxID=1123402 RepID=A0A1I0E2K7_9GAMM|nr:DNA polymerase III subunit delta' C-terminal domain-containing protein [Thorsellia anophelis]SET39150.1 DNA polymerase-3 subunit delta' [Thorsellia anophelis DSM 18579]